MLLVTFLSKSFPFGSVEIQTRSTIRYSRNPCSMLQAGSC